jgi:hypothetical protein
MVSMTFFTFSLMMPSHYEGSGVFPEILGKDRMMVEQRNFGIGQETTLGREARKVGNGCPLLETPKQEHPLKLYVLLVIGLGGTILHDLRVPRE